jgi:hypothetical protein
MKKLSSSKHPKELAKITEVDLGKYKPQDRG